MRELKLIWNVRFVRQCSLSIYIHKETDIILELKKIKEQNENVFPISFKSLPQIANIVQLTCGHI